MAAILAGTQVGIQAGTQVVTQAVILVDILIGAEVVAVEVGAIVVCLLTSKISVPVPRKYVYQMLYLIFFS